VNGVTTDLLTVLQGKRRFLIHAKPNAKRTEILSYAEDGDFFIVAVKAPPVNGKANEEIERHFSKLLRKKVVIKTGNASKKKLLEVQ
jgi:hypothetical protein